MASKNVVDCAKKVSLSELAKRVPPNQSLQFAHFKSKCEEYQARVNKLPSKLPTIDWEFYMLNVKPEMKKWVEEFQQKYKNLSETFDARANRDYSKYYTELEAASAEMQCEIENFKAESNERIKKLQEEYESIKMLKPYEDMTAQEYCELLPDKKMYMYEGRPSYWPHTPEEQSLEKPLGHDHDHGHDDSSSSHSKPPKDDGGKGEPPKGGISGGPGQNDGGTGAVAPMTSSNNVKDTKTETKNDDKPAKSAMKKSSTLAFSNRVKFSMPMSLKSKAAETFKVIAKRVSFKPIVSDISDGRAKKSNILDDPIFKKPDSIAENPDLPNTTIEEQIRNALFPAQFENSMKEIHQIQGTVVQK